jgi:hypothetical protein
LEHSFFFDGDTKRIVWVIQTNNSIIKQKREHADIFLNKVTIQQSKYIALHVGLFWGIGRFIINNDDHITIKIDEQTMFNNLSKNEKPHDELIKKRIYFISKLVEQRKLKIKYEFVSAEKNLASMSL